MSEFENESLAPIFKPLISNIYKNKNGFTYI